MADGSVDHGLGARRGGPADVFKAVADALQVWGGMAASWARWPISSRRSRLAPQKGSNSAASAGPLRGGAAGRPGALVARARIIRGRKVAHQPHPPRRYVVRRTDGRRPHVPTAAPTGGRAHVFSAFPLLGDSPNRLRRFKCQRVYSRRLNTRAESQKKKRQSNS